MKNMNVYEKPQIEVLNVEAADIVTASLEIDVDNETNGW